MSRWKVACINWGHPTAPHAAAYLLEDGEARHEHYFATWPEAVNWVDWVARRAVQVRAVIELPPDVVWPEGEGYGVELRESKVPGLRHRGCAYLADVLLDLDCAYCPSCKLNVRINSAWIVAAFEGRPR